MQFQDFKSKAKEAIDYAKPHAKTLGEKTKETLIYAKENPKDGMLAILTVLGIKQSIDIENIEENTEVSAVVDIHEFMGS